MSKRRDKRVPQEENEEAHEIIKSISQNTDTFVIKQKFILNPVHETFYNLCLHDKTKMLLVDGPAGSAKAQPLDAKIITPAGIKKMEDMEIGSIVSTPDGQNAKVVGVFPQGEIDIYRVSFSDGTTTECCEDHLWLTQTDAERNNRVRCGNRKRKKEEKHGSVRSTKEILNSLFVTKNNRVNHSIPTTKPVNFTQNNDAVIHPYILGVLLGDGCVMRATKFTSYDEEIPNYIETLLPEGFSLSRRPARKKNSKKTEFCIKDSLATWKRKNRYTQELINLGILGKKAQFKFIPKEYLFSSVTNRLALLRGLMDTDGTAGKCSTVFSTSSDALATDFQFLVESLGGIVSIKRYKSFYTYKGVKKQGLDSIKIVLSLPPDINPFNLSRKATAFCPKTKYKPTRYITGVDLIGKKKAQCIMLDSADHLYLTNNFIVTHNTFLAAKAGLTLLKEKKVDQIIYIRSIVESASKSIGALPGEIDEKFKPWSMPLLEKLNELIPVAASTRLFEREAIKCIPVNFVRGLTFHNSFVIVDEAQNLTKEELITILTRFGQYSKYVVIGDTFQRDIGSHSGFMHVWHRFNDEESQDVGIHTAKFTEHEIVRSPILKFIVKKLT